MANCTLGLMVAARAAFGPPAGERRLVLTPSFTFPATACAVRWAGFTPLFAEVEAASWHLDPVALETALDAFGERVAGVMACSTFGAAPPPETRDGWRSACRAHGTPLVVDSAAGFGAVDRDGRRLGSLGDTEVFSFHATKPFAIGEGGAVFTADPELAARLRRLINFGIGDEPSVAETIGLNAKLSELHAATGLAALDRYDGVLARRRTAAAGMLSELQSLGAVGQAGAAGSTWQFLGVQLESGHARDAALRSARESNVQARTYFCPPLHRQPAFSREPAADRLAVTDRIAERALSLPLADDAETLARVTQVVARGAERVGAC